MGQPGDCQGRYGLALQTVLEGRADGESRGRRPRSEERAVGRSGPDPTLGVSPEEEVTETTANRRGGVAAGFQENDGCLKSHNCGRGRTVDCSTRGRIFALSEYTIPSATPAPELYRS